MTERQSLWNSLVNVQDNYLRELVLQYLCVCFFSQHQLTKMQDLHTQQLLIILKLQCSLSCRKCVLHDVNVNYALWDAYVTFTTICSILRTNWVIKTNLFPNIARLYETMEARLSIWIDANSTFVQYLFLAILICCSRQLILTVCEVWCSSVRRLHQTKADLCLNRC